MSELEIVQTEFSRIFAERAEHVVRAPGRVNLIGEHTDYNGGFVLPMAIDSAAFIAARRRPDRQVRMVALDFGRSRSEFSLDAIARDNVNRWGNYVRGVALVLEQRGVRLGGIDLAIHSTVPVGSGLSSSAALEVCAAFAFLAFAQTAINPVEIAQLCQKVENDFVGVKSGIMDQFVSVLAQAEHALLIDCRDLSYQQVPMPEGTTIVVCDTKKRRGLVTSEYNTRRAECEEAARRMGIRLLRDVSVSEFARWEPDLPPVVARRARHIVTENERVLHAVHAMQQGELVTLGRLMNESHSSLKDDYEVSSPELDLMVDIARHQAGCLGARLTGAGFGGCTVNLVQDDAVQSFVRDVAAGYKARAGIEPPIYVYEAAPGASVIM
jgi:galactokinase